MSLSHSSVEKYNTNQSINILQEITDFSNNLHDINKHYDSYEQLEKKIQEMVSKVELNLYEKTLEQYDINVKTIEVNGLLYNQVLRKKKRYLTSAGFVEIERSIYRGTKGKSLCPLELQAGIIETNWTPTAARIGYYVTAELTPYAGEKLLKQMGHFTPSKSSLQRLSQSIGETWERKESQFSKQIYDDIKIPEETQTLSISFDGIMLPLNKKINNGYKAPNELSDEDKKITAIKEKPFYREAACAAINFYDDKGDRLKTIRFARMPESGKKILKSKMGQVVNSILNQKPELELVKIADGAKDNWRYLSNDLLPGQGVELLDYYHASEHLSEAINAAFGKDSSDAKAEYKKYRSLLKNDLNGIDKVINMLRYSHQKNTKNKTIKKELSYFRNNRHRMSYAQMLENNRPIGSGVTEASCKTLVTQRMKCAGMRWDITGGQGILTARSLIQSEQFDQGWKLLASEYKKEISLPKNVVAFKAKK
jgi:hypothetical protein